MTIRTMLSQALWDRLAPLLPPQKPRTGRPALDHRRFLEAVLWLSRTGAPWRDLPSELRNWCTAWRRLQRWTAAGLWARIVAELRAMAADAGWQAPRLDSRVIRTHDHDRLGVGPRFETGALRTGRRGRPRWKPAAMIADKVSSAAWLELLCRKRIVPVLPSRSDEPEPPDFDRKASRERNRIERLVGKLKPFRRVATRYDKLDAHCLAFVQLASVMVWLRTFGGTA